MITARATIRDGRIELDVPIDLPDGTAVIVEVTPLSRDRIGIHESEWRDDAEALADWDAWIKQIEPFDLSPGEHADHEG